MNRLQAVWLPGLFSVLTALSLPCALGQDAGGLRGVVVDAEFGVPISQASIQILELNRTIQSDDEGRFLFENLPAGAYSARVEREGFAGQTFRDLVISAGSLRDAEFAIAGEVVELEEFSFTAPEEDDSAAEALDFRQDLTAFADVLGEGLISQTGAAEAGKILEKAAGITVIGGREVVIRGLADRYNTILLNNLYIPSSDPERRNVNIDLIPARIIENIAITKTFSPDQPGESTGGSVNILTKAVPDEDFIEANIGVGYNIAATGIKDYLTYDGPGTGFFGTSKERALPGFIKNEALPQNLGLANKPIAEEEALRDLINATLPREMGTKEATPPLNIRADTSLGKRFEFFGRPAGVLAVGEYRKNYDYYRGASRRVTSLMPLALSRNFVELRGRETLRGSLFIAGGIELDEDDTVKVTYLFNRVARDTAQQQFGESGSAGFPDGVARESLLYEERDLRVGQIAGEHIFGDDADWKIEWRGSISESSQLEPDQRLTSFPVEFSSVPPVTTADISRYNQPNENPNVPLVRRIWRELKDNRYSMGADATIPLFKDPEKLKRAEVKIGGAFDYTQRDYRQDSFAYNLGNRDNRQFPDPRLGKIKDFPAQTWGDKFLYGLVPVSQGGTNLFRFGLEEYDASQSLGALYAMVRADLSEDFEIAFGARVENTDIQVRGTPFIADDVNKRPAFLSDAQRQDQATVNFVINNTLDTILSVPELAARGLGSIQQTDLLPSVSFTWDFFKDMKLRGAWSRTVARPTFREMAPLILFDVASGNEFLGNVDLEMSSIFNYDARWEWFPAPGDVIAASAFTKQITEAIELTNDAGFSRFRNSGQALVYGIELEFQKNLGFLHETLADFTFGSNFSKIISSVERPDTLKSVFGASRPLQGQPDYLVNLNLTWDNENTGLSAGILLNLTGPSLVEATTTGSVPDLFQAPSSSLDAFVTYQLNERLKLTLRGSNLLGDDDVLYYDIPQRIEYSFQPKSPSYSLTLGLDW